VKASIQADLPVIDVLVCGRRRGADAMRSVAENLIRADVERGHLACDRAARAQNWNEQASLTRWPAGAHRASAKLLAHLHPPMLDVMALGSMPNEEHLRTIAMPRARSRRKCGRSTSRRRVSPTSPGMRSPARWPSATCRPRPPSFGDDLAKAYGIVWEDDLFAPPGEDSRYTTNVEGFFGAQQEWLQNNLPERGRLLPVGRLWPGQTAEEGRARLWQARQE